MSAAMHVSSPTNLLRGTAHAYARVARQGPSQWAGRRAVPRSRKVRAGQHALSGAILSEQETGLGFAQSGGCGKAGTMRDRATLTLSRGGAGAAGAASPWPAVWAAPDT
jgi:hypothetical protein